MEHRELLAPWMLSLRDGTELNGTPTPQQITEARASGILWVRWAAAPCEALELLMILEYVDRSEWQYTLRAIWPETAQLWFKVFRGQRFRFGIELRDSIDVCEQLLFEADATQTEHSQLCEQLANTTTSSAKSNKTRTVPVRLVLGATSHVLWLKVREVVAKQAARDTQPSSTKQRPPLFRLVEVTVQELFTKWSSKAIMYAQPIVLNGVAVHPLCLLDTTNSVDEAAYVTPSLQLLMGVISDSDDDDHNEDDGSGSRTPLIPVEHVVVHTDGARQVLDSIFSAIVASPSVRHVSVTSRQQSCRDRERLWQWLAIVFFSEHATDARAVETLTLSACGLRMMDVYILESVLRDPNSWAALFPAMPPTNTRTGWLDGYTVTASAFRLVRPPASGRSSSILLDQPLSNLRILEVCGDWLGVLLPGWGQAWVPRGDVVLVARNTAHRSLRDPVVRPLRTLELTGMDDEEGHVIRTLFQVIGRKIRKLTLTKCRFPTSALRCVLRECSGLEELELRDMDISVLKVLASSYEAGDCRVQRLGVSMQRPRVDAEDITEQLNRFVLRLKNKNHVMTRLLRSIHFDYHPPHPLVEDLPASLGASLLQVLERNPWLRHVYVDMRPHDEPVAVAQEEREQDANGPVVVQPLVYPDDVNRVSGERNRFDIFDGTCVVEPLPMAAKTAFLGVVHCRFHPSTTKRTGRHTAIQRLTAIERLDNNILSVVFAFAADPRTRFVDVWL